METPMPKTDHQMRVAAQRVRAAEAAEAVEAVEAPARKVSKPDRNKPREDARESHR